MWIILLILGLIISALFDIKLIDGISGVEFLIIFSIIYTIIFYIWYFSQYFTW